MCEISSCLPRAVQQERTDRPIIQPERPRADLSDLMPSPDGLNDRQRHSGGDGKTTTELIRHGKGLQTITTRQPELPMRARGFPCSLRLTCFSVDRSVSVPSGLLVLGAMSKILARAVTDQDRLLSSGTSRVVCALLRRQHAERLVSDGNYLRPHLVNYSFMSESGQREARSRLQHLSSDAKSVQPAR